MQYITTNINSHNLRHHNQFHFKISLAKLKHNQKTKVSTFVAHTKMKGKRKHVAINSWSFHTGQNTKSN